MEKAHVIRFSSTFIGFQFNFGRPYDNLRDVRKKKKNTKKRMIKRPTVEKLDLTDPAVLFHLFIIIIFFFQRKSYKQIGYHE